MTPFLLSLILLHACDASTTASALQHGAREGNPLLGQSLGVNLALQAGLTTVQVRGLSSLSKSHPRWAKGLAMAALGFEAGIVAQNVRVLRAQR